MNVGLNVLQVEARGLAGDLQHEGSASWVEQHPVEEVAFDGAKDALLLQKLAGEHVLGAVRLLPQRAGGDGLGNDGEIGVLQEERVAADRLAIDLAEQPVPELALERDLGMVAELVPQRREGGASVAEGEAVAAERALDGAGIGWEVVAVGERGFEPGE